MEVFKVELENLNKEIYALQKHKYYEPATHKTNVGKLDTTNTSVNNDSRKLKKHEWDVLSVGLRELHIVGWGVLQR